MEEFFFFSLSKSNFVSVVIFCSVRQPAACCPSVVRVARPCARAQFPVMKRDSAGPASDGDYGTHGGSKTDHRPSFNRKIFWCLIRPNKTKENISENKIDFFKNKIL